ncbi:MAG: Asp-tRNA(Asn)/Glu-tRNA(Gln) amidotransferase subunit GatB [Patescibacteria group bacterium]|nr:Asp-tRNA(Asn)/Glu-tRNA(Gln) amidotransferase subunit GatB [Patescibacteria group bacterium]
MTYKPTIGLEIHVELKTKTKMFCGCLNNPDEEKANMNICPVCLAHPGTLPVPNKEAIEKVLKLGIVLNSELANISKFDRKNYFYPDLPKGYQISQYDQPLVSGGLLTNIRLTRIHLEEDTGRLLHTTNDSGEENLEQKMKQASLVDFNRAGIPLMELVTEPDIKTGKEAVVFAKELQLILRYLGISDADMEKGHMRIEANISIAGNQPQLGTKVEVKNLNSFKAVESAIDYEIKRQEEILEKGEKVVQETRGWDDAGQKTFSQRLKEEAHDYRYFPEPDIPPFEISFFNTEKIKSEIPELPAQKRERFFDIYKLSAGQTEVLIEDKPAADYFEKSANALKAILPDANFQLLYNYLLSDLKGLLKEQKMELTNLKISPENFAHLINLAATGKLTTSRMVKDVLKAMFDSGMEPDVIIKEKGFHEEIAEETLEQAISEVISENPKAVEDYKKGQENAMQFLTGMAMKKLQGKGNPQEIKEILKSKILQ